MERAPWSLVLILLFISPMAGASGVNADGTISADTNGANADPLAGYEKQIHMAISDGAQMGVDAPTQMVFNSGKTQIRIDIGGPPALTSPPPPSTGSGDARFVGWGVVLALALFALSLSIRDKIAARPPFNPHLGESPFTIVKPIGSGGMGMVYEAIDINLDRRVAVKCLHTEPQDGPQNHELLLAEAKTVAKLHHPNIVDIHAIVSQGGQDFMVFELIDGKTVEHLLAEHKHLGLRNTKAILDPVCRALEFAHERGIIHRDLKPSNIMITSLNQVKVMDFGIARQIRGGVASLKAEAGATDYRLTNAIRGTLPFMAPEAWVGVVRAEGDVYALGVMAYLMLSGAYPFPPDSSVELKMARGYEPLSKKMPGLPAGADALIDAALEPDADKRLRTPREFRERLTALV